MKVVLLLLLVVFAAWPDSAQAQKGLRLCGREFYRAVVYTCGGSRWRRVQTDGRNNGPEIEADVESVSSETDRIRRAALETLTDTCCKVGCRTSDLVRMC